MRTASWETITGQENLLILAPRPGDESSHCGGLIARSCRRGRPPYVVVLTDGITASDPSHEAATRAATRVLGLPGNRLLLAGLFYNTLPTLGPAFNAIVHGITTVMWARDCNVICAPWQSPDPARQQDDATAAHRIAETVARQSGVGLLYYLTQPDAPADAWRFDITAELMAKRGAIAEHAGTVADPLPYEHYLSPATQHR